MPVARTSGNLTYTSLILTWTTSFLLFILAYIIGIFQLEDKKDKMDENTSDLQITKDEIPLNGLIENGETSLWDNNLENVRMSSSSLIIFDLETSGLSYEYAEILQLSAVYKEKEFNKYIQPLMSISYNATMVNKLSLINDVLCYDKNPVESTSLLVGLKDFLEWLKSIPSPRFLVGHNVKNFDCPFLLNSLSEYDLMPEFSKLVVGFIDTLPLCRDLCPKTEVYDYKQNTLVNHYLQLSYKEHNALEDVIALQKLVSFFQPSDKLLMKHMFSVHSSYEHIQSKNSYKKYLSTYYSMIKNKGISKEMATRFAKANITYKDLIYNYKNGGIESLKEFLSTPKDRKGFGTKSSKVIEKLCNYFKENNC